MKKTKESSEKIEILEKLGFKRQGNGFYTHEFINNNEELIDLSAVSIPGIIANVFKAGCQYGENAVRIKLLELLGVDK